MNAALYMPSQIPDACDVAVVGGGPSGLAMATRLKQLGVGSVLLLEREHETGGIPRHCAHSPFGMREFHRVLRGQAYGKALTQRAINNGVQVATGVTVVAMGAGPLPVLTLSTSAGLSHLTAKVVVIATGVREASRAARLIGGTRPGGVLTTGTLQTMLMLKSGRPFRRPLLVGSELVSFSALLTCRSLGIKPQAMLESGSRVTCFKPSALLPRVLGVPVRYRSRPVEVHGRSHVEAVSVEMLGEDGKEERQTIETDGLLLTGAFVPESSLARLSSLAIDLGSGGPQIDQFGRCSDPSFFACGNLLRPVETAGWSWQEGHDLAPAVIAQLKGSLCDADQSVTVERGDDIIKLVVPQRLAFCAPKTSPASDVQGLTALQIRLTRAAKGTLRVEDQSGHCLYQKAMNGLPERRILIPLSEVHEAWKRLDPASRSALSVRFKED